MLYLAHFSVKGGKKISFAWWELDIKTFIKLQLVPSLRILYSMYILVNLQILFTFSISNFWSEVLPLKGMDAPERSKSAGWDCARVRAKKHEWILWFSNDTARQVATIWHCGRMAEVWHCVVAKENKFDVEMATQKPVEWVSSLIIRFEEQVSLRKVIFIYVNHHLRSVSAVRDSGGPPTLPSPIPRTPTLDHWRYQHSFIQSL